MLFFIPPIIIIALSCLGLVSTKTLKWTSNPYLIPPMSAAAVTQYLVFHGQLALNYTLSRVRCEALGGDLADVDSMDAFNYLHNRLHGPAYIGSFDGHSYGGPESGLALYPGGAVAIPLSGAAERFASICEVPLLGTYAIDLSRYGEAADRSIQPGDYGNTGNSSSGSGSVKGAPAAGPMPAVEALMHAGFVMNGRRDPRFAGLSQQVDPVAARDYGGRRQPGSSTTTTQPTVETITIYGSIETDPALPCCRCCNGI